MTEQQYRENIVLLAKSYIGTKENDKYHHQIIDYYNSITPLPVGYKMKYTDAWCAAFVSVIYFLANCAEIFPFECSCGRMLQEAIKMNIWIEDDSYHPKIGDCVLYDWQDSGKGDDKGWPDHVGIVIDTTEYTFTVVEGNCNDSVDTRTISIDSLYIRGFISPNFRALSGEPIDNNSPKEELSDAQIWFRNTFHIVVNDGGWDDRVALTYKQLAEILYILK